MKFGTPIPRAEAALRPTLLFTVQVTYEQGRDLPVEFGGELRSEDGKLLCRLEGAHVPSEQTLRILAREDAPDATFHLTFAAEIGLVREASRRFASRGGTTRGSRREWSVVTRNSPASTQDQASW
jgi:hypothetical protein